jgi:cell division protease FtsH
MEKMDKKTQFNMWYVFIAIWGVLLLQSAWRQAAQVEQIPYSEFRAYLEEGLVEEVQIGQDAKIFTNIL